ncbi:hypothetical protein [Puniceibacterium sediminis]|uniref:Uncharacterized protein n=1 Tax=Puniceibacterium sediminis TaxID=1608407 RepID=A0A238Y1J9_9RHOB|nr:hypothetical protein [Puniceibacterium sediminis]SNR65176.1 hypothetical protein SAMN06265370_11458 [Puniceibacterium sediminis]
MTGITLVQVAVAIYEAVLSELVGMGAGVTEIYMPVSMGACDPDFSAVKAN